MEDAKITEQPKQEPLYQQGRYPSIVDTDDLVFEMGKQVVNHLNHEKLIDRIVKQTEAIQQENLQLKSIKIQTGQRIASLELKEKQLEEIIKQTESIQQENLHLKSIKIQAEQKVAPLELKARQLDESNKLYEINNRKLDAEIVSLRNKISTITNEYKNKEDTQNKNIESLKAEIIELKKDKQTIVSDFRNEKETFNKDINNLKTQIKKHEQTISEFEVKETELNKKYEECSNTLKKRKAKADKKNQITTVQ